MDIGRGLPAGKDLVHEKKILLFLKEDVLTMRIPKKTKGTKS